MVGVAGSSSMARLWRMLNGEFIAKVNLMLDPDIEAHAQADRRRGFSVSGGTIRYHPTSASAVAWRETILAV
jgi:hypothetical protein